MTAGANRPSGLQLSLTDVVGGRTAKLLDTAFEMRTVGDLLRHYPRRLAERGELTDLASLRVDEDATVVAEVQRSARKGAGSGLRLEVVVGDGKGTLTLVFFGKRNIWRERELYPGQRGMFSGRVKLFNRTRQLAHPEYQLLGAESEGAAEGFAKAFAK